MAITWSILAAVQLGSAYYARRQQRRRVKASDARTTAH